MKQHYEKVVVFCCFLLTFCNIGLPSTSFSVYQPYLVALPGVGDTAGSLIIGVRTFVSLVCMVIVGRFYAVFDCRAGCFIASILSAFGLFLFGAATSLPFLFLAALFTGAGYGLGGMIGTTLLINRWFKTNVGVAVGITAVGSGAASIIIPLIAEPLIRTVSLTAAFWLEAAIALIIAIITFTLLRNRPEDMGRTPYVNPSVVPDEQQHTKLDTGVSLRLPERRIFFIATMFLGAVCVASTSFLSILLVSEGFDHSFAAWMLSVLGISLTLGKLVMGKLFDAIGVIRATTIAFLFLTTGLICLCLTTTGSVILAFLGTVFFSSGMSISSVGIPIWSLHLSTPAERGKTVRHFQVGFATGSFLFNLAPGILMDLVGNYVISYALLVIMSVAAFVIIVSIYSKYYGTKHAAATSHKQKG